MNQRDLRTRFAWLALAPLALFALALRASPADLPLTASWRWIPSLGIDLAFFVDGLSLQFVLLITGVGAAVFLYAAGYLAGDPRTRRLYVLLFAFMAAMLGCVTSADLLLLFLFWELTSITSFMLVGTKHEYEASRKSAQQALLVTGSGGLALLAGILLIGEAAGTYQIQELLRTAPSWREKPQVTAGLVCLFIGAFTKSAQIPFHFWLPNAMAAPTPVSAYLHSATMVKLGVYLLARLHPAFGDLWMWQATLVTVGGATAAWSMVLALRERDLKRILAWSTVSALGTLVMLIGLPGEGATAAVATFLLAHALYKAPLFFVAGNVDLACGTRSIDRLAGLAPRMPYTAAAALLAGLSMSGIPLSFGYVAKDVIKVAKSEAEIFAWVAYLGVFVSAASIAAAGVATIRVFWHRGGAPIPSDIRLGGGAPLVGPPLVIAALGIVFGLFPELIAPIVAAAADSMHPEGALVAAVAGPEKSSFVALAITLGLGVTIFLAWDRLHAAQGLIKTPSILRANAWYERLLALIPAAASAATRRLQHGSLTGYTLVAVAFLVTALGAALFHASPASWPEPGPLSPAVLGACLLLVAASAAVCLVRDSFVLLLTGGLIGLPCALLFLFLGAPDVAFTQLAVEVAMVVVIASILLRVRRQGLAPPPRESSWPRAVVALAAGAVVALLALVAGAAEPDPALPRFFAEKSVPEAYGRNVVNVILVDFRAVDTLGEVIVVAVTFLAAAPLLALLRRRREASR